MEHRRDLPQYTPGYPPDGPAAWERMIHYLLMYDFAPDYLERRVRFREAHLALAWRAHEQGEAGRPAEVVRF